MHFVYVGGGEPVLDQMISEQDAAIQLPASLFQVINDVANVGVFFGRYEVATLFPVGGGNADSGAPRQTQVFSQVLAATVGQNNRLQNLPEPVRLTFRLQEKDGMVS